MKIIQRCAYGFYLACILALLGISLTDWQWWVAMIPMVILVEWKARFKYSDEEKR